MGRGQGLFLGEEKGPLGLEAEPGGGEGGGGEGGMTVEYFALESFVSA